MRSPAAISEQLPEQFLAQPSDIRTLQDVASQDRLIISMQKVDGKWELVSVYGDSIWWLAGSPTNVKKSGTKLDFTKAPEVFRDPLKAMMYRYMRRGANNGRRPGVGAMERTFRAMTAFLRYVERIGITTIGRLTPMTCMAYVQSVRATSAPSRRSAKSTTESGRTLSRGTQYKSYKAIEDIFALSQYTSDPMPQHPWLDSSADSLAGYSKSRALGTDRTPLIPDATFAALFQEAWKLVQEGPALLDMRDSLDSLGRAKEGLVRPYITSLKTAQLRESGIAGFKEFKMKLTRIRTACYIVVASLSGCRAHEVMHINTGSLYSTEDNDGERIWWMRSKSTKTYEGDTEWMIPEAAVQAIRVLERWAQPYQEMVQAEIETYRSKNRHDVRIAEAEPHLNAIFVGVDQKKKKLVRTLGVQALNNDLKAFAKSIGEDWFLQSHQFRRTFANYAARSQFGDLRYLRAHFKHWSMDMTLGYALNDSQEMSLYLEIQDELEDLKLDVAATWLDSAEPLAGGYGQSLVDWRSKEENVAMFKSHSAMIRSISQSTHVRSNGHAWCTAQDNLCVGNDMERTRCGDGCENAVIGRRHAPIYQGLYDHLKDLRSAPDIGPGGQQRVSRDLDRCAKVLRTLGHEVEVEA